ncbi:hypothetical protein ACWXWU_16090 [Shewanella sp. A14]
MNARQILTFILLIMGITFSLTTIASDKPYKKMTLSEKGEQAQIASTELEQAQLQKAREATKATLTREKKVLAKQRSNDWEAQQLEKAASQSNARVTRESKYLQQAQEAATQIRKIPKETTEPVLSE